MTHYDPTLIDYATLLRGMCPSVLMQSIISLLCEQMNEYLIGVA